MVGLVNIFFPKIEEKTDSLRNQLEEACKIADEITDYKETTFKDKNGIIIFLLFVKTVRILFKSSHKIVYLHFLIIRTNRK